MGSLSLFDPEIEPRSPALQVDSLPSEPPGKPVCILTMAQSVEDELDLPTIIY